MRIGIVGTRGIPNYHGGFEQFAEYFAVYGKQQGHDIFVYNSHNHPFQEKSFEGVEIIHCYDPEEKIGTAGQFIYDFNCIRDARKRNFDVILQLGYTSSSIWGWLLPKKAVVVTNMDGLEWKRSKYSKKVQRFLKYAEKLAIKTSDYLIADSIGIQDYLKEKYQSTSEFIAYGSNVFSPSNSDLISAKGLLPNAYYALIARMEPENNIEMILDGYVESKSDKNIYVVGNTEATVFGRYLKDKFSKYETICFLGAIYDLDFLNQLRYYSTLYFHGHSVGGTNPSLLEAMGSGALIAAHDNAFNKAVLESNAFYFDSSQKVASLLKSTIKDEHKDKIEANLDKIKNEYNWERINKKYIDFLIKCKNESV